MNGKAVAIIGIVAVVAIVAGGTAKWKHDHPKAIEA